VLSIEIFEPLSKPIIGSSKSVNIIPFPISRSPPDTQTKSTLIDDIVRPSTAVPFGGDYGTRTTRVERRTEEEESIYHQLRRQHQPVPRPVFPKKPTILTKPNILIDPSVYENESNQRRESIQSDSIRLNTFSVPSTSIGLDTKRSLTTLSGRFRERVHEFDRPDSTDYSSLSSPQPQPISSASPTGSELLQRLDRRNRLDRQQNVIVASALPRRNFLPDEVDRSIGSSTLMDNNDVMSETPSDFYQQAAELRLNLFLTGMDNGSKISIDSTSETTV